MDAVDLRAYLRRVVAVAEDSGGGSHRYDILAAVAAHVGAAHHVPIASAGLRLFQSDELSGNSDLVPPPHLAVPELLGHVHAALQSSPDRRRRGLFITPPAIAAGVTAETLGPLTAESSAVRVCDPAAGGGAFLIAAARQLVAAGSSPTAVVSQCLFGADVDPLAGAVTEASLAILGWDHKQGAPPAGLSEHLVCGDALLEPDLLPRPFDVVLANPPFLNQLQSGTTRSRQVAAALSRRFGEGVRAYTDGAAVFLLLALDLLRDGGRAGVILPVSLLATRDAGPVRVAVTRRASLDWLWVAGESVFDADVSVCALSITRGAGPAHAVRRATGPRFAALPDVALDDRQLEASGSWSFLMTDLLGIPKLEFESAGVLGDSCRATADFRDQFYGLAPVVEEASGPEVEPPHVQVITCGLIDPAISRWGRRPTRLAGRRFARPVVDRRRLETETTLGHWAAQRLQPKVLVATQTRVIEAVVDEHGRWLPSTPVITMQVDGDPSRLWHIAAALASPVITAVALERCAGAGMSAGAIKLSAKQVMALPGPVDDAAWDEGATAFRAAAQAAIANRSDEWRDGLHEAARAMCSAYRVTDPEALLAWWSSRLPRWRAGEG